MLAKNSQAPRSFPLTTWYSLVDFGQIQTQQRLSSGVGGVAGTLQRKPYVKDGALLSI